MKTIDELFAPRLDAMNEQERAKYDEAYRRAEWASRMAELCYQSRTAANLTQAELARRMGTTQSAIARIEDSGTLPTVATLVKLAAATGGNLNITIDANLPKAS